MAITKNDQVLRGEKRIEELVGGAGKWYEDDT